MGTLAPAESARGPWVAAGLSNSPKDFLKVNWILDSGCSQHCCNTKEYFDPATLRPYTGRPIQGLSQASTPELVGTVRVPCQVQGKLFWLVLRDTLYNSSAICNIVSWSQLHNAGADLRIDCDRFTISTAAGPISVKEQWGIYLFRLWRDPAVWRSALNLALPAYAIEED
jgi:hypothetical protein